MTTPLCLPSSLALPLFSPFSHFTHLRTTKRNGVSKPNCHSNVASCQTPNLQNFQAAWHQPTCPPNSICIESTTREGAPVAEGLPEKTNGIGDSRKKRQRQKHAHHQQQFTRAQFPGGQFPAKFGCQPIKLELYILTHAYPANYVRVHFRVSGYIKRVE